MYEFRSVLGQRDTQTRSPTPDVATAVRHPHGAGVSQLAELPGGIPGLQDREGDDIAQVAASRRIERPAARDEPERRRR
jgi:hypothetical protein